MEKKYGVKDGYWLMGFQYEITGSLYSFGQIPRCKVSMLEHLQPGSKLLVAGAGVVGAGLALVMIDRHVAPRGR